MYWYAKVEKQKEEKLGIALMRKPINTLHSQGWKYQKVIRLCLALSGI